MIDEIQQTLALIKQQRPLVLCLTNSVTMDFMANALLAVGAAPIMSEEAEELDELIGLASAMMINIGTLNQPFINRCEAAAFLCTETSTPMILDPVGAGASKIRTETAQMLMKQAEIIRGNASEIMALSQVLSQSLGVESIHTVTEVEQEAHNLARQLNRCVAVSGPVDLITNGNRHCQLALGSDLMPLVTGMGCTLTAIIAAFRAVVHDNFAATQMAMAYYSLCGSVSETLTNKPASFKVAFIDQLYAPDWEKMRGLYEV